MVSFSNRQGPAMWLPMMPRKFSVEKNSLKGIRYLLTGITKDSAGSPLGSCSIEVFETIPGVVGNEPKGRLVNTGTSDASGNYSIEVHSKTGATFRCVAYKGGSPDVAGTTVNTLTPTIV